MASSERPASREVPAVPVLCGCRPGAGVQCAPCVGRILQQTFPEGAATPVDDLVAGLYRSALVLARDDQSRVVEWPVADSALLLLCHAVTCISALSAEDRAKVIALAAADQRISRMLTAANIDLANIDVDEIGQRYESELTEFASADSAARMAFDPGQIYEHCQFLAEVQLTRYNFKSAGNVALVGMSFQQTILKLNSSIPSYPVLHYTLALSRLEQGDISGATYWAEAAFKLIRDTDATESKRCCVWDHLFIKVECLIRRLALLSDEVLRYCELLWWISERCCGSCLLSQYRLERAASTLGTMFMWVERSSDASNVYQKFVMLTEEKIGKHTVHYVRALMHGAAFNEKVLKRIDRAQSLTKIAILIAADVDRNLLTFRENGRIARLYVNLSDYNLLPVEQVRRRQGQCPPV
eukprot:tig00000369_g24602.t1